MTRSDECLNSLSCPANVVCEHNVRCQASNPPVNLDHGHTSADETLFELASVTSRRCEDQSVNAQASEHLDLVRLDAATFLAVGKDDVITVLARNGRDAFGDLRVKEILDVRYKQPDDPGAVKPQTARYLIRLIAKRLGGR